MSNEKVRDNPGIPATEDLQNSEIRYRRLFESAREGILILNFETRKIIDANPFMTELLGYRHEEFLGKELWEIGLLKDAGENVSAFQELLQKGYISYDDLPLETKAGKCRNVEFVSNVYLENGRQVIQCNIRDITERKWREEEVIRLSLENERQACAFDLLLTSISDMTYTFDRELRFRYANKPVLDLYGIKSEDLIGKNFSDLNYPEDLIAKIRQNIQLVLDTGVPVKDETQFPTATGELRFYEYIFNPVVAGEGTVEFVVGSARDITERKQNEEKLRQSEQQLAKSQHLAHIGSWSWDLQNNKVFWSDETHEIFGISKEQFNDSYQTIIDVFHPEDRQLIQSAIDAALSNSAPYNIEHRIIRPDGEERFVCEIGEVTFDEAGKPVRFTGTIQDITERKLVGKEKELLAIEFEHQHQRLNNIIGNVPGIVWEIWSDSDNAIRHTDFVSEYVEKMLGYTVEEWLTMPDFRLRIVHPEDREKARRQAAETLSSGKGNLIELRLIAKDGSVIWTQVQTQTITDDANKIIGVRGIIIDISERKNAEEALREIEDQLRQSQKLESVGLLAGGIAHDFTNMLTVINGYSDLMLRHLTEDNPMRRNVEEIKKAGLRSADLTQQLLAFSRQQVLQPVVIDLNEIITDTITFLRRLIGEDIQLITSLNPKCGHVKADPGQFSQIVMNLAINSRDAMLQGGKLTIETANVFLDPEYSRQHLYVLPGAYVMLAVIDTGTGMSDETLQHIFEPFFTTKEIGKGTGLGLSTVYGIVKQSGGSIEVHSEPGVGTTFKIYLPRVVEEIDEMATTDTSSEILEGTETILLVEDEEMVRNLSREILEECGYTVIEAENGAEALAKCAPDCQIDLLMTDVVMPVMGGRELAEKLNVKMPSLQVLYTSGYTSDAVVRHGVIEANTNFIQKPFSPRMLANKVRQILDHSNKS